MSKDQLTIDFAPIKSCTLKKLLIVNWPMSLIISLGSNLGNRLENLEKAISHLRSIFCLIAKSNVYVSKAVDYTHQPMFYNQMLEFALPKENPWEVLLIIQNIEKILGRKRTIPKGPRTIDIDIIFYANLFLIDSCLTIPHPRWNERSFIVQPLCELPYFQQLKAQIEIPLQFSNSCYPLFNLEN